MKMETKLKKLLDYQKFESNPELEGLIQKTTAAYPSHAGTVLKEEELGLVTGGTGQKEEFRLIGIQHDNNERNLT